LTLAGVNAENLIRGISLISSLGDLRHYLLPIIMDCPFNALVWKLLGEESAVSETREKFVMPLRLLAKNPRNLE